MSKKSRKRNKKILAAIGIGLGAAALASKRKKELGDTETTSRMGSEFTKSTKPTIADVSNTAKKDTAVKTKTTIQDNKPKDTTPAKVRMTSANVQSGKIAAPYKDIFNFGDGVAKRRAEEASFNAKVKKRNNPAVTGTTLPGQSLRSGGRAGYKSGGKTIKKSMGKALRGGGKVIR